MAKYEKSQKDIYAELTEVVVANMEKQLKYETPWFTCTEAPYNPVTGTIYSGPNQVSLRARGFTDPRFYTFNNVKALAEQTGQKIHVKAGMKGSPVYTAIQSTYKSKDKTTEGDDGSIVIVEGGAKTFWRYHQSGVVFNALQIEGIEPLKEIPRTEIEVHKEADLLIEAMIKKGGITLEHSPEGRAFYQVARDKITLPEKELFKSTGHYYSTALHEFAHATGHPSRLNRDMSGMFGSASYAKEELIAEMTSYFIGSKLGIPYDSNSHENHSAYVQNWLQALKNDTKLIFTASAAAQRSVDYQLDMKREYVKEQGLEHSANDQFHDQMEALRKQNQMSYESKSEKKVAIVR